MSAFEGARSPASVRRSRPLSPGNALHRERLAVPAAPRLTKWWLVTLRTDVRPRALGRPADAQRGPRRAWGDPSRPSHESRASSVVQRRRYAFTASRREHLPGTWRNGPTAAGAPGPSDRKALRLFILGDPAVTRTRDLRFRKPPLYPAELRGQSHASLCSPTARRSTTSGSDSAGDSTRFRPGRQHTVPPLLTSNASRRTPPPTTQPASYWATSSPSACNEHEHGT